MKCFSLHIFTPRIITLTTGLVLLLQCVGFAWNHAGHRIIASIAYDQLEPAVQLAMVALLKQHPRFEQDFQSRMPDVIKAANPTIQNRWIFMRAATWPDLARGFNEADREKYHNSPWHYINRPVYLDLASEQALSPALPVNLSTNPNDGTEFKKFNLLQALEYCVSKMKDPAVSKSDKAVYLCWIMHLTGDSHQPLHSSALFSRHTFPEGDRGGNSIRIGKSNLHSQWDRLLGSSFKYSDIVSEAVGIARNPVLKRLGEKAAQQMNYSTWINESHQLAKSDVYTTQIREAVKQSDALQSELKNFPSLPAVYYQKAGTIAVQRAAQSGWRLAEVINNVQ